MQTTDRIELQVRATQVPAMKAGRHEQMIADGWNVIEHTATDTLYGCGENIDEFGCNTEVFVRVERSTRNVLDFG